MWNFQISLSYPFIFTGDHEFEDYNAILTNKFEIISHQSKELRLFNIYKMPTNFNLEF